jgi:predicted dehydrogenase
MNRFLIHETGIHFVDTFRFLLGDVDAVAADLRRLNPAIAGEDAGVVQFRFASGARGVFDGNRLADHAAENRRFTMGEMWLDGSLGTLRLDGYGRIFFRAHGHDDEERVEYSLPLSGFGGDSVLSTQQHVVDHLLRGAALETAAKDYLANLVIEEAIYLSDERGCWVSPDEVAVQGAPPIRQR